MTNAEINTAIAEATGWILTAMNWWFKDGEYFALPPDYCTNLNAMHEAEKVLTDDQRWEQVKWIVDYRQAANGFPMLSRSETLKLYSATARQRAEAFLKTLNLYTA